MKKTSFSFQIQYWYHLVERTRKTRREVKMTLSFLWYPRAIVSNYKEILEGFLEFVTTKWHSSKCVPPETLFLKNDGTLITKSFLLFRGSKQRKVFFFANVVPIKIKSVVQKVDFRGKLSNCEQPRIGKWDRRYSTQFSHIQSILKIFTWSLEYLDVRIVYYCFYSPNVMLIWPVK